MFTSKQEWSDRPIVDDYGNEVEGSTQNRMTRTGDQNQGHLRPTALAALPMTTGAGR